MTCTDPERSDARRFLSPCTEQSSAVGRPRSFVRFDLAKSDDELLADVCDWLVAILGPTLVTWSLSTLSYAPRL